MLVIKLFIEAVLLVIFLQDIRERAVYWILFPVLALLFLGLRLLEHEVIAVVCRQMLVNIGFLAVQVMVVSAYFSLRRRQWTNITINMLGWGDLLFLLTLCFYLSVLNFLAFYIASLIIVLGTWITWQMIAGKVDKEVPLAGLQALLLAVALGVSWWICPVNLTDDDWLLRVMYN